MDIIIFSHSSIICFRLRILSSGKKEQGEQVGIVAGYVRDGVQLLCMYIDLNVFKFNFDLF